MTGLTRPSMRDRPTYVRSSAPWPLAIALCALACSSDERGAPAATGPRFLTALFLESAEAPLTGTMKVTLDRPARLAMIAVDPAGHRVEVTSPAATSHELPLLGLRAARTYTLTLTAIDARGEASTVTGLRQTASLPADFPPLRVVAADRARPGLTLFPVSRFKDGTIERWGYLVAIDAAGEVVWYVNTYTALADVQRGARGQIRYMFDERGIAEVSPLGKLERALMARGPARGEVEPGFLPVDADNVHHDVAELPNGHWLTLATVARTLGPKDCPSYDATYKVVGDEILELDPTTGNVASRVSLFDLLDPCRRVDGSFKGPFWGYVYGPGTADWTHSNSVFFDPSRNTVVVSMRHQDWVIGYRYAADAAGPAGQLLWRFGPEGDFALDGVDAAWPYHQHAARLSPDGRLMLFDNGTTRPGTNDFVLERLPTSRAVEFSLSATGPRATWKATQLWQHGEGEVRELDATTGAEVPWYAPVVGDAVRTADDTVLITEGAVLTPANGYVFADGVKKSARIVEVERAGAQRVTLDVRVEDPASTGFASYLVYRAARIPTLYPPGVSAKVSLP